MPAGRPLKYKTPQELENRIDEYFSNPDNQYKKIATISDLILFLGFCDRNALNELAAAHPEFSRPIKKAKMMVAREYESHLLKQNCAGAIFALKNFGWTDKTETEHNVNITLSVKDLISNVENRRREIPAFTPN